MRNWLLAFALLGCSGDPDVVVYVVNAEGGSSSVGGATEIDETKSSVGGKLSASGSSAIAGSGGSSQSSGSYGGSSTASSASSGGSSAQASQTSRALTIAAGGSYQLTHATTVFAVGGTTQASTTTEPTVPSQDCKYPSDAGGLCGPASKGLRVCDEHGECVRIDVDEKKLDCDYNGIPETPVDDENCDACGYACQYGGAKCLRGSGTDQSGKPYQYWRCALPTT